MQESGARYHRGHRSRRGPQQCEAGRSPARPAPARFNGFPGYRHGAAEAPRDRGAGEGLSAARVAGQLGGVSDTEVQRAGGGQELRLSEEVMGRARRVRTARKIFEAGWLPGLFVFWISFNHGWTRIQTNFGQDEGRIGPDACSSVV